MYQATKLMTTRLLRARGDARTSYIPATRWDHVPPLLFMGGDILLSVLSGVSSYA